MTLWGHKAKVQCLQSPLLLCPCCLQLISLLSGPGRGGQGCYQHPGLGHMLEKAVCVALPITHSLGDPPSVHSHPGKKRLRS